jgi:hypothetical protein
MSYNPQWQAPPPPMPPSAFNNETGRKTYFWYKIYCGFLAFIYFLLVALGIFMVVAGATFATKAEDAALLPIMGVIYGGLGFLFMLPFTIALFLKPKPWVWIYGLVLICIGFMGCPTIFASIFLLIFWIKPETKAYFGRN